MSTLQHENRKVVVADVAAGPGGWTDSVMQWAARENWEDVTFFGYTLQAVTENRFRPDRFLEKLINNNPDNRRYLNRFTDLSDHFPEPGVLDGDITNIKNIDKLEQYFSNKEGIDLFMSDGGDPLKEANIDEDNNLSLIMGEMLAAITLMREGGTFILKMFSTSTPASWWTISTIAPLFATIRLCKPAASRVSNSEVYLVCKNFNLHHDILENVKESLRHNHANKRHYDVKEDASSSKFSPSMDFGCCLQYSNTSEVGKLYKGYK